ncbi:MAG: hypothetical protein IH607_03670, partial [Firmicutes bacterium]|nr:hypothetical protein [Bacillota bacterium]
LEEKVVSLKAMGLRGVEVFHPSASQEDAQWLYEMARQHQLLVTGGSDFHGDRSMHTKIGEYPAGWLTWQKDIEDLFAAINETDA